MGRNHGSFHIFKLLKQGWACCINWYSEPNNSPYSNRIPKQPVLPDWHKDLTFHFLLNKSFQFQAQGLEKNWIFHRVYGSELSP